jgi:hypothetical protein
MGMKIERMLFAIVLLATVTTAIGCGPNNATINFAQIGACNGYKDTSSTLVSAGSNAAYVVFRVDSLDNTGSSVAFAFDPSRMWVSGTSPHAHIDPGLTLSSTIGVFQAPATSVPAKQLTQVHGFAVAVVSTSGGDPATQANQINYFLSYDTTSSDPGVLAVKKNASQTSYPGNDNCLAMSYPLSLERPPDTNRELAASRSGFRTLEEGRARQAFGGDFALWMANYRVRGWQTVRPTKLPYFP